MEPMDKNTSAPSPRAWCSSLGSPSRSWSSTDDREGRESRTSICQGGYDRVRTLSTALSASHGRGCDEDPLPEMGRRPSLTAVARARSPGRLRIASLFCALTVGALAAITSWSHGAHVVVAAAGLGYTAATDWSERRVPRWAIRTMTLAVVALVIAGSRSSGDWAPVGRAGGAALLALAVLGCLWWWVPAAIGLGDVKATALAMGSAACDSWRAMAGALFATSAASVVMAAGLVLAARRGERVWDSTMPFVPALCVGFIVGIGAS